MKGNNRKERSNVKLLISFMRMSNFHPKKEMRFLSLAEFRVWR
jgi:hypothetical protein